MENGSTDDTIDKSLAIHAADPRFKNGGLTAGVAARPCCGAGCTSCRKPPPITRAGTHSSPRSMALSAPVPVRASARVRSPGAFLSRPRATNHSPLRCQLTHQRTTLVRPGPAHWVRSHDLPADAEVGGAIVWGASNRRFRASRFRRHANLVGPKPGREPGGEAVDVIDVIDRRTVDRTSLHRVWKAVLIVIALAVATACYFVPVLLVAIGVLLLLFLCARLVYQGRDRYIPNLYARDIRVYEDAYRAFIGRTLSDLRRCRIRGHTLLWEASRLPRRSLRDSDELMLDLGVWIGWSTRLISDASDRAVYGFDTFEGLVEDWQIDDQIVIKSGTFSLSEPLAQRFIRDTGVSLRDGVPDALGRKVQFIRGSTYETLDPFLADRPAAPIRLFHMDLDTYESCLHALETCKDRFI